MWSFVRHNFWEIWRGVRANLPLLRGEVLCNISPCETHFSASRPDNHCTVRYCYRYRCCHRYRFCYRNQYRYTVTVTTIVTVTDIVTVSVIITFINFTVAIL